MIQDEKQDQVEAFMKAVWGEVLKLKAGQEKLVEAHETLTKNQAAGK